MLKLGLVGHHRTIAIVRKALYQYDPSVETTDIALDTMDIAPVVAFIKENEQAFDGLLFTGKIPYDLINTAIFSQKPWVYIRRDSAQLLRVLLEATYILHLDLNHISIDSYSEAEIHQVFADFSMPMGEIQHQVYNQSIYSDTFLSDLKAFHLNNYKQGRSAFCITGISGVYEYLTQNSIPCLILDPTFDGIRETLQLFQLKRQSRINENSQIVVLAIERDLPGDHALIRENEYQLSLDSMKIAEEIYLFAQRIQAAVIEKEIGKYLLFTTKNLFELETEQLQRLNLLTAKSALRYGTLSIGIGYGETAREAKYSANLGMLRARKSGGNQAYKVQQNQYFGPIVPMPFLESDERDAMDDPFQKAASSSGVSLTTILKLHEIINREKTDVFTPLELSLLYGISIRSMHRLLEKLSKAGYVKIMGRNFSKASGRPSRLVKIKFHD